MIRDRALAARDKLVERLPVTGELLRGTLLERIVRHKSGCPKCARGKTRQISIRRERVAEIRRWLANYQELKEAIEAICELNHDLLRPQASVSKGGRKKRD
jgi:hypothetical protein